MRLVVEHATQEKAVERRINIEYQEIRELAINSGILTRYTPSEVFTSMVKHWGNINLKPNSGVGHSLALLTILSAQFCIRLEDHFPAVNNSTEIEALGLLASAISNREDPLYPIKLVYGHLHVLPTKHEIAMRTCLASALEDIKKEHQWTLID